MPDRIPLFRTRAAAAPVLVALALVVAGLTLPEAAAAQAIGIAPKVGTAGAGADIGVGLGGRLSFRGGIGFIPIEIEDVELDDQDFTLTTPDFFATLGADFKVIGPLRLMGGVLIRSGDFEYSTDVEGSIEIGNQVFTVPGRLFGKWENDSVAPFVGIGLGTIASTGFGIFLDAGVAFTGDPEVTAEVSGTLAEQPGIQAEVERERQRINDDIPDYAQYWPFVQIGFKIGLGR